MAQARWSEVDHYFSASLGGDDAVLEAAIAASERAGLPAIQVSTNQGKLLHILARSVGARRILEIGTLGGYSTIWLARALAPGGRLVSLEAVARHAEVARENIARAGLADMVEVRLGRALDTLPGVAADGLAPFDFVFIDADKQHNPDYFAWGLRLTRPGGLIVVDNVVRSGRVVEQDSPDADVRGVRRLVELIAREPRVCATAMQTVGSKGYDGLIVAIVLEKAQEHLSLRAGPSGPP